MARSGGGGTVGRGVARSGGRVARSGGRVARAVRWKALHTAKEDEREEVVVASAGVELRCDEARVDGVQDGGLSANTRRRGGGLSPVASPRPAFISRGRWSVRRCIRRHAARHVRGAHGPRIVDEQDRVSSEAAPPP